MRTCWYNTFPRAWSWSATCSFRLTQWLKIIPHMIRSYYRCCCVNEPVIFSHFVKLKRGHWFHALSNVCSDHDDDTAPLSRLLRPGISFLKGQGHFVLSKGTYIRISECLGEHLERAPRPRPGQQRPWPLWPPWNSRPDYYVTASLLSWFDMYIRGRSSIQACTRRGVWNSMIK